MNQFLHVANGTSTTMTIEAARIPGAVSIWADPLHDGPVPGGLSDDELLEVRARHLSSLSSQESPQWSPASAGYEETVDGLKAWRRIIAAHDTYRELVLWYEHDLFDQLNLLQLLTWIRSHLPARKPVSLICIDSFPGRPTFKGLGELTVSELAPLLDTRQPVTNAQFALADRAWRAFREPAPTPIDDLRRDDTAALPFLSAALTAFLREFPWTSDGLSRSERRLLELASGGITLNSAFLRLDEGQRAYYVTDLSLQRLADELTRTSPALLTWGGGASFRTRTIAITESGRRVLAGDADRVSACGIDRWYGGVHLQPGNLWRWDDESQRIGGA